MRPRGKPTRQPQDQGRPGPEMHRQAELKFLNEGSSQQQGHLQGPPPEPVFVQNTSRKVRSRGKQKKGSRARQVSKKHKIHKRKEE